MGQERLLNDSTGNKMGQTTLSTYLFCAVCFSRVRSLHDAIVRSLRKRVRALPTGASLGSHFRRTRAKRESGEHTRLGCHGPASTPDKPFDETRDRRNYNSRRLSFAFSSHRGTALGAEAERHTREGCAPRYRAKASSDRGTNERFRSAYEGFRPTTV